MKEDNLRELVEKVTAGVATEEEVALFNAWYQSYQEEGKAWPESELMDKKKIEAAMLRSIEDRINSGSPHRRFIPKRQIAAAVVLLLVASGVVYWLGNGSSTLTDSQTLVINNDVAPGMETAVLTLGDGRQIVLDEAQMGVIANEGHTSVQKTSEGLIAYQAGQLSASLDAPLTYNTISTPKGGKYKVVLPDETEVWLNAMSSIRFPTRFTGSNREVEITGEVYFDVTRNSDQPFWVRSDHQTVKVLGTEFNVKAYTDEQYIHTTLVEGSVLVETDSDQVQILPGQQAIYHQEAKLAVESVDTEMVIAWKDGLFQFWNTGLEDIMRQLSRWYDVDVSYLNENKDISFTGFISRDVTISKVLQMLEETGNIKFGLDGRQVVVRIEQNDN